MKQFHCKYCNSPMNVNSFQYKSNQYCNNCFDKRAKEKPIKKADLNKYVFMGMEIPLPR